jgi:hypothetical protein
MTEKDWRTVTKSLYILHCISRDSSVEACTHFNNAFKHLSKTRNPKNRNQKYFDLKVLTDITNNKKQDQNEIYQAFLKSYGNYLFQRMKSFSGKFNELDELTQAETPVVPTTKKGSKGASKKNTKRNTYKNQEKEITQSIVNMPMNDLLKNKKFFVIMKKAQQSILSW